VAVPEVIPLELEKYLQNRGTKKLDFKPEQEFKDPTGLQDVFLPPPAKGLPGAG
jgi:nitrite reductase (cytochrome c-552)